MREVIRVPTALHEALVQRQQPLTSAAATAHDVAQQPALTVDADHLAGLAHQSTACTAAPTAAAAAAAAKAGKMRLVKLVLVRQPLLQQVLRVVCDPDHKIQIT
jgi:hypothetical protein